MEHKLRRLRLAEDLTQAELALLSGISQPTISLIENCSEQKVREDTAEAIAGALYLPVTDIFDVTELTNLGRPARSGVTRRLSAESRETLCPHCYLYVWPADFCTNCGGRLRPPQPEPE